MAQTKVRIPNSAADPAEKNLVRSLAKGFAVLHAFTAERDELTLAEVARAAGIDNATAFRFLNTLVMLGYVARVPGTRRFRLTLRCLDLGFNAIARADLRMLARPILRDLVGALNEAASIGVLDGADVVYVERIQAGIARLGVDVRIGSRVPVYSSAIGRAILAFLPRETQLAVLEARPREKLTEATVTDRAALLAILERVRADGIALSDQETVPGLRVLACPLLDADGVPLGGISVAAPALRMSAEDYLRQAGPPLIAAARALSRGLEAAGGTAAPARPPLAEPTPTRRHRP
ncbi:helix-turn-helix domain-containing protein [Elioraea sp. Yellowstone]|jgi:IclR family pca regulon transcriptional regulator|uniref:IclR family transcriptional regulator n=1 Tax=Elioraea sp. Yellowstone TaxID=2592070 RepID=UPI0011533F96|nr:IclR family transcriptional regulator C-terminal domain-containing protein [Elioraea sp. Yellowstone]TQF77782.1 helix-turn-helix domain-containing protein [Elioraea sp. Yellowstone]